MSQIGILFNNEMPHKKDYSVYLLMFEVRIGERFRIDWGLTDKMYDTNWIGLSIEC